MEEERMRSKGVNYRKDDPHQCMVVGCARLAIYRNAASAENARCGGGTSGIRGFCSVHKELARVSRNTVLNRTEHLARHEEQS
jgi:hypothetical protein